jgi:cytochrome c biogenesis protein CcdA/DsbC/DsbD-like thiol-disulfide interchange protein
MNPLVRVMCMAFLAVCGHAAAGQLGGIADLQAQDSAGKVNASLAWYEGDLVPGREASLGVILDISPKWHIQAGKGSGDDQGDYIATTISVKAPDGWTVGTPRWPEAHEFALGEGEFKETLRGYEGRTLIIVPIGVSPTAAPGEYPITVQIDYQACDALLCDMPTATTVEGTAKVIPPDAANTAAPLNPELVKLFESVLSRTQKAPSTDAVPPSKTTKLEHHTIGNIRWWLVLAFVWLAMIWMIVRTFQISKRLAPKLIVTICGALLMYGMYAFVSEVTAKNTIWTAYSSQTFNDARAANKTILIKFTADWCPNCQVNERIILANDEAREELMRSDVAALKVDFTGPHPEGDAKKAELGGGGIPIIAVYPAKSDQPIIIRGLLVSAQPVIDALHGAVAQHDEDSHVFDFLGWQFEVKKDAVMVILGLAFLAGFFMNFTPCVLPVIPIKILSLQAHAQNPRRCFVMGLVFGLGIIALYAALGLLIAGLVVGAKKLDWGDQFQNWWFNAAIGLVVLIMAVGMLGMYAIRLPQFLYMFNPQSDTLVGSFWMGLFAAILSTPCTGPLLGATIAWVATQTASIAFLTLVIMGVGMAFPYVLLTAKPSWLAKVPRTGPGSELVKQVMGLLLIAVAIYFIGNAAVGLGA